MKTEEILKRRAELEVSEKRKKQIPVCQTCKYYLSNPDKCKVCESRQH